MYCRGFRFLHIYDQADWFCCNMAMVSKVESRHIKLATMLSMFLLHVIIILGNGAGVGKTEGAEVKIMTYVLH